MNLCILLFLFKYVFSSMNDDSYNTYYGSNDDIIIEPNDDFFYTHNVLNMNYLRRRAIACNSETTNRVVDWTGIYTSPVKKRWILFGSWLGFCCDRSSRE